MNTQYSGKSKLTNHAAARALVHDDSLCAFAVVCDGDGLSTVLSTIILLKAYDLNTTVILIRNDISYC